MRVKSFIIFFALIVTTSASAQTSVADTNHTGVRVSVSGGINTLGIPWQSSGLGIGPLAVSYQCGDRFYSLQVGGQLSEFQLFEIPHVTVSELTALYGVSQIAEHTFWSYAGGVSYVYEEHRGAPTNGGGWFSPSYQAVPVNGVGLIAEVQGVVTVWHAIGIGGTIIGSLNTAHSYLAALFTLMVGSL